MARTGARLTRLLGRTLVVALPLALVPVLTSFGVGFFARRGAAILGTLASRVPAPGFVLAGALDAAPADLEWFAAASDPTSPPRSNAAIVATEPRRRSAPQRDGVAGRRGAHHVHIGPDAIRRAVPVTGRPRAAWTNRSEDHPAGMLISNPGALAGTIQPGDIVFEAEGRSLESFEQLVAIVGQAYQRRARIVSGRLWRRGEPWTLTVEPGWAVDTPKGPT
jgi:hypothetical protein